ncbi:MAG: helix-turn-helix domain-containing protein [Candidatus Azambacteria bacterium]|nr:helix-turn-helix domain-containing protein [Candidatus Azambacteria bacterium]
MKFEDKKNLAEFLKEKRQGKNLSLDKLSDLTKIQVYHLEALEAGQFEKLPPLVYRAGIFKRLSKFLDVDENEIIRMYKHEIQVVETSSHNENIIKPKKNSYFVLTQKKLAIFLGALLLILLFAYLWYQFKFLVGPPNLAIDPKEENIKKQELLTVKGKTDNGVDLTINGENVYVASNGSFSKDMQLAGGINVIEVKAVNNFGKSTKIVRQIFRDESE